MRALFNKDIATGRINLTDDYGTTGPSSTWHILSDVLPPPEPECFIPNQMSCSEEQWEAVKDGRAIVKDWIVVGIEEKKGEVEEGGQGGEGVKAPLNGVAQEVLHSVGR